MKIKFAIALFFITLVPSATVCANVVKMVQEKSDEPSNQALVIPMESSSVSVLYDPSDKAYFSGDGIKGTSDGLIMDLGNIDFGDKLYNKIWIEMSNMANESDSAKFQFYIDGELILPDLSLDIPVNEPVISYESSKSPQSGMFFKNAQSGIVTVFDVRKDESLAKLSSMVMQGIINQQTAQVYLYVEGHHITQLAETGLQINLEERLSNDKYGALGAMVNKYGDLFNKLVVWDENKEWTWCLAQMISAQQGGIPVTEDIKNYIVNDLGWTKDVYDIRNLWTNKLDAYQWAIDNLAANCHPNIGFSAGLRNDYVSAPWKIYDYAAATKGFVFYLSEKNSDEAQMIEKICQKMNYQPGASIMGYGASDDGDGLNSIINKYNAGFIVSDYYANGSFWCSFPSKSFNQRKGKPIDAKAGKVYVSFIWSDGDNIQFDANKLYLMFKNATGRGEIPVGVTLAPGLQEINPFLLEYFYKNLTPNDELMAGPSGFQFIYGDSYNSSTYNTWLGMNKEWIETAGFNTACLWNTTGNAFDEYMRTCNLQGIFDGWSTANNKYINNVVAVNQGTHCFNEGDVYNDLVKAKPDANKPIFRNLYLIAANYGGDDGYQKLKRELLKLENDYPDRYVYLLPMDLCATLKKYIDENGGSYN
ncbi:MAG: hypothetical protein ACK5MK_11360 [Dysgonomonas sp.]